MTQTNRSLQRQRRMASKPYLAPVSLAILCILLSACNASVGAGGRTGTTRVGGSVGSTGGVVGISTSVGPGVYASSHRDFLRNGPTSVYKNHKQALKAMNNNDFDTAASIFENTLKDIPAHPDATYFLGLTRIHQGQREEGFTLLKSYRDPDYYRMTSEVQRMARYLEKKPELTAKTIHETMNRNRSDGYNRDIRERQEMTDWD